MRYSVKDNEVIAAGKWPANEKDALEESIRKWEYIARWHRKNSKGEPLEVNGDSCALCQVFVERTGSCEKCPVMRVTGFEQCGLSPFETYQRCVEPDAIVLSVLAMSEATFLKGLRK